MASLWPHLTLSSTAPWLWADLPCPCPCLSWAIVGGGAGVTSQIAWYHLLPNELRVQLDPKTYLQEQLKRSYASDDVVGLLTSRRHGVHHNTAVSHLDAGVECVATVGLSNALRVGDPTGRNKPARAGTINILVHCGWALSENARLETLALANEAKCAAVLDSGEKSRVSLAPATGTGTDCLVITNIPDEGQGCHPYAGKHTGIGQAVGESVYDAVKNGITMWRAEQEDNSP